MKGLLESRFLVKLSLFVTLDDELASSITDEEELKAVLAKSVASQVQVAGADLSDLIDEVEPLGGE